MKDKHLILKRFFIVAAAWALTLFLFDLSFAQTETITRKHALIIAESTPEARGLYELQDGKLSNCIEKKVVRPCDTDWVSCVDDAWVVQIIVGERCPVEHDGRLGVTVLINSIDGEIMSIYPERDYFFNKTFCIENTDCLCLNDETDTLRRCLNFIHGQLFKEAPNQCGACICHDNTCIMK